MKRKENNTVTTIQFERRIAHYMARGNNNAANAIKALAQDVGAPISFENIRGMTAQLKAGGAGELADRMGRGVNPALEGQAKTSLIHQRRAPSITPQDINIPSVMPGIRKVLERAYELERRYMRDLPGEKRPMGWGYHALLNPTAMFEAVAAGYLEIGSGDPADVKHYRITPSGCQIIGAPFPPQPHQGLSVEEESILKKAYAFMEEDVKTKPPHRAGFRKAGNYQAPFYDLNDLNTRGYLRKEGVTYALSKSASAALFLEDLFRR